MVNGFKENGKSATKVTKEKVVKDVQPIKEKVTKVKLTKEEKKTIWLAKKAALITVFAYCNAVQNPPEDLVAALKLISPKQKTAKAKKENAADQLKKIIGADGAKHEDHIWKEQHVGRAEMFRLRQAAKKVGYFVNFNLVDGMYQEVEEKQYIPL